jgi:hypothetical protein
VSLAARAACGCRHGRGSIEAMRGLVGMLNACAAALACACGTPPPAGRVDSMVPPDVRPSDAMVPVCVSPAEKPPEATGTIASGVFAITWTAVHGEIGNINPLITTDRLTIDAAAGTARYDNPSCPECLATHTGALDDGCLRFARGNDGATTRDEYLLCATSTGVIATITWCGFPGPPAPRTWRVTGT